jgi:hypothetical protein
MGWTAYESLFDSGKWKDILFYSIDSGPALVPTQPPIQWALGALSRRVKRQGNEADPSPPSTVKIKNGGAIRPLPLCLHGTVSNCITKCTNNFTILLKARVDVLIARHHYNLT